MAALSALPQAAQDLICLLRCAANGSVPDAAQVRRMDLDAVYALARRHMLSAAAALALERAGFEDARSRDALSAALRRAAAFDAAMQQVSGALDAAGLWYAPLKGAVLRELYPAYGLREMADVDLLIDPAREDEAQRLMEQLGFTLQTQGSACHRVYRKGPFVTFELHSALFAPAHGEALHRYYQDVRARLVPSQGSRLRFTDEDFYVYLCAHAWKHFNAGGAGLRLLMDLYLYTEKTPLNETVVRRETEKLGIDHFEARLRALSRTLFAGEGEADAELLSYMLHSGAQGSRAHLAQNGLRRAGGSPLRYAIRRLRVPLDKSDPLYSAYAARYPLFYRHKLILPLLPAWRFLGALGSGRLKNELSLFRRKKRENEESFQNK